MNTRLPTCLAHLNALFLIVLFLIVTAAPSHAQDFPQPRDDTDEYAPRDPATGQYIHKPEPVHLNTSLQHNIKPGPVDTVIDSATIQPEPELNAASALRLVTLSLIERENKLVTQTKIRPD